MENQQKELRTVQKYNALKNSIVLSMSLYFTSIMGGIIGGFASVFMYIVYFEKALPLPTSQIYLYIKAWIKQSGSLNYQGNNIPVDIIIKKLDSNIMEFLTIGSSIFFLGFVVFGFITYKTITFFSNRNADKNLKDKHLRGTKILTEDELYKIQKEKNVDGYNITPKIKIDREHESKHIFVTGSVGSGKSVNIKRLYRAQKRHPLNKNAKWIIHDVKGEYLRQLLNYGDGNDLIFNMSDVRSINFNIFNYMNNLEELKSVVSIIIPKSESEKDPIWTNSARTILTGILLFAIKTDNKKIMLVKKLLATKAEKLAQILSKVGGSSSEFGSAIAMLDAGSQSDNYMANLQSRTEYFQGLSKCQDDKENFDIEKWLKTEGQSTIFMINDVANADINAARIAVFVESFIKIILSGKEGGDRKYLILDEIGMAQRMDVLPKGMMLSRSYNLSILIGIQEIARFDAVYSAETRRTLINNSGTKIILRSTEFDTVDYLSKVIGEREEEISSSGISIGTEANRDGESLNQSIKKEFAVLPSQIANLKTLEYYIKQPDSDWGHIQAEFNPKIDIIPEVHEAIIKCPELLTFDEVEEEDFEELLNGDSKSSEKTEDKIKEEDKERNSFG